MYATSLVMFSEWNGLHPTLSTQTTHHGQDLRPCLRFQTFWMLQVIFFISGNFSFSFVSTSLAYITIPKKKRKTEIYDIKKTNYNICPVFHSYALSSIHKMCTSICNTLRLQKVVCPYKGLLSEENDWNFVSKGKWLRQQGSCFNKELMWRSATILCDPCKTCQTRYLSIEDFGVLKSCFSYFIHFCYKLKIYWGMTDFIRPFYSCMLKTLVLECMESRMWVPLFTERSVSLMCIWTLFTFEKKWSFYWNKVTFSLTCALGQGTQHPTVKVPLRVFTQKGYTFCSTGLIRFLQKTLYMSVECRSK